jgi:omega-6 fatty acid desaturase (delta-12 desaturase)
MRAGKVVVKSSGGGSSISPRALTTDTATVTTDESYSQEEEPYTYTYTQEDARRLGFDKIGKPVPKGIPFSDVLAAIPKKAFEKDNVKAYKALAVTLIACAASHALIAFVPNWLLPVAWTVAGTAWTGLFVLGHDCAHRSFHTSKLVEDVIGTALMSILIYPYEGWKFKHAQHHAKTNMLVEDTAWHPVVIDEMDEMSPLMRRVTQSFLGTPTKFWGSIIHWLKWHFDLSLYKKSEKKRVLTSIVSCATFAAVCFPLLFKLTGVFGFVKFWLMPWMGFHFWLSAFTLVHHTSPHIPFKTAEEWDPVQAQLGGTVHCVYPKWVEFLCHDINVHVPHHLSPRIPHYRLRMAYDGIKEKYGEYVNEATFNWRLVKMLVTEPHVYDEETNYKPFKHYKNRYGKATDI